MHILTQVWLLCFVYSMCVSCIECRQTEELMKTELQPTEEETVCNITISHRSASYLMIMFNKFDPDVAHFNLKFPNGTVVNYTEDVIQPFRWIWTFQSDDRNVPFLEWGIDYEVLSLGLLNAKSLPESFVEFDVQPPNCSITIGNRKSNLEIAYAFSNMTNTYLNSVDFKYKNDYVDNRNHSWCFVAERKGSYQYNCCYSYYDFVNEEINVNCSDNWLHDKTSSYSSLVTVLYILGFIIVCYFPIPLLDLVSNMSEKNLRDSYMSLNDNLTSDYVYLDKHSPITLGSIIYESCCPRFASRICGALFIIFFPVFIYIELILYYVKMNETTCELIKHGTDMQFLSMLVGFEKSRELYLSIFGGPYLMIILFCAIGIVLVALITQNVGNMLEYPILEKIPFVLGYGPMQLYSHMQIDDECVYIRLKSVMIARLFCIMNPAFWCHVRVVSFDTFKECLTDLKTKLPKPLYYCLALMIYLICLLRFFIQMFGCLVFYGLPLVFIFFLAFPGLRMIIIKWVSNKLVPVSEKIGVVFTCIVGLFLMVFVFSAHSYFSFSLLFILSASVEFILKVFVYIFLAVVVYPSTTFVSYQGFCIVLFYYLFKQLRGIGETYFDLLSDVVKSLHVLEEESVELSVVTNYKDRVPGIPRKLFLYVVQKHRPVFISVFKAILPIGLVGILMLGTIHITSFVSNDSSTITEIMKMVLMVLVGTLPRAVEIAFSNSNKSALKEVFLKTLEATILEYNESLVEPQS